MKRSSLPPDAVDADDVRAEVGQQRRAVRPGDETAEVQDLDAFKYFVH